MRPYYQRSVSQRLRMHINKVGGANYANEQLKKRRQLADAGDIEGLLSEGYISRQDYEALLAEQSAEERRLKKEDDRAMAELERQRQEEQEQAAQHWFGNTGRHAKKRDLAALDRALQPGAYAGASREEELLHQKRYIEDIKRKYGEDDPEVRRILAAHDTGPILREAADIERIAAIPDAIKERAGGLENFWASEGMNLSKGQWLEVAQRVEAGEEIRDILSDYGY